MLLLPTDRGDSASSLEEPLYEHLLIRSPGRSVQLPYTRYDGFWQATDASADIRASGERGLTVDGDRFISPSLLYTSTWEHVFQNWLPVA